MGCISNKPLRVNEQIGLECDNLMKLNLVLIRSLQLILIEDKKSAAAIFLVFLQSRLEFYYVRVKKYREYWVQLLKDKLADVVYSESLKRFEKMQSLEKEQVMECNLQLTQVLYQLRPEWGLQFESMSEFLESLEGNKAVLMIFNSFYKDYSGISETGLVGVVKRYGKFGDEEKKMLDRIVGVTLKYYDQPTNMVYCEENLGWEEKSLRRCRLKMLEEDSSSEASGESFNFSNEE